MGVLFAVIAPCVFALIGPLLCRGGNLQQIEAAAFPFMMVVGGVAGIMFGLRRSRRKQQSDREGTGTMEEHQEPGAVGQPRTSALALWSLVLGIVSVVIFVFGFVTAVPAVVLGHLGRSRIKRSNGLLKGRSLAAAGVFLGYFVLVAWSYAAYHLLFQKFEIRQAAYQKDYEWGHIEVGTEINFPVGRAVRDGRFCTIVASTADGTGERTVLYAGPKGEQPTRPTFLSGDSNTVTYAMPDGSRTNLTWRP